MHSSLWRDAFPADRVITSNSKVCHYMSTHRVQSTVDLPCARAVSVLTSRPAGWLRGFLRLAVAPGFDAQTDSSPHWYRVGRPATDPAGATVMTFVWGPHTRSVFDRFAG
jgi:hypothetical protein